MNKFPRRGEIWLVNWNPARGSEQTGKRPALIESGLHDVSMIKTSQILTISKIRLEKKLGQLSEEKIEKVNQAIKLSLGL